MVAAVDVLANAAPGFALILIEKAAELAVSLPSVTATTIFETVPAEAGDPDRTPVPAFIESQDGPLTRL